MVGLGSEPGWIWGDGIFGGSGVEPQSVLDAGWSMFRTQLQYKGDSAGSWVRQVNEAFSTQEGSCCHARSGPKGLAGLDVHYWTCSVCQSVHDRDTNAAKNILARGLVELEKEFSIAGGGESR